VSVYRSTGMRCGNTVTEHMIRDRQRKIGSTGIVSGFKLSSSQLVYRNISPLITLTKGKTRVAEMRKRRVQD
jgi:hypothetical protein